MITFVVSIVLLIAGFFIYGKFVEKNFRPDPERQTPAVRLRDDVDYIPMPTWKVYLIQFLNIAGTGPIFGAILGILYGPAAFIWIVLGCIFIGSVHDYLTGMISIRKDGVNIPEIVGDVFGKGARLFLRIISLILLILVGAVFARTPANLIAGLTPTVGFWGTGLFWLIIIIAYYILATLLPIDKLIGKFYPIFAACLLFMAIALMVCLFIHWPDIPEFWQGLGNKGAAVGLTGMDKQPIFPCLFITIACGALSGFHSTQSPLMARCMENENEGRETFYGAMISEGIVALIWAAVASYFFFDGGAEASGSSLSASAPEVVTKISKYWLGTAGSILAIIGVAIAPITSGDTAFRSARLILADAFHIDQKPKKNRLFIAIPIFAITLALLAFNIKNEDGFNIIWRYFGWANLALACFTLWAAVEFLLTKKKGAVILVALIPAMTMTSICFAYIATAKIGFGLPMKWAWPVADITFIVCLMNSIIRRVRLRHQEQKNRS